MNETVTMVRGTIITDPVTRRVGDSAVHAFRVACNHRYLDRESQEWRTSSTLYLRVSCWGTLAAQASVFVKGDAVLVMGRLFTNEYEKDGVLRSDLEMKASTLGPDLTRMVVAGVRRRQFAPEVDREPAVETDAAGAGDLDDDGRPPAHGDIQAPPIDDEHVDFGRPETDAIGGVAAGSLLATASA